jgi:hypothetical protein
MARRDEGDDRNDGTESKDPARPLAKQGSEPSKPASPEAQAEMRCSNLF